jgi:tetratricopeptide (TPR) repeat protein
VRKAQGYRQRLEETIAEEPSPGFFHPLPEEFLRSGSVWLPYGAMLMNDEMGDRKTRKSLPETFAFIKRAMDSGVFEYESLLLAALASSESGKKENALVFMLHALQKQPDDLTFLEMLARAYLYQNRASKAMDVAKKMLRWHPNQVVGYMIMGESLTRLGRSEEALSHFERAVGMRMEVDPWKKSQFDFAHALAWMELGRMDKAREALASGTDAHPDDWVVRLSSWPVRGLGWLMRRHAQRRLGQEPAWAVQDWDAYMQWRNSVERSV